MQFRAFVKPDESLERSLESYHKSPRDVPRRKRPNYRNAVSPPEEEGEVPTPDEDSEVGDEDVDRRSEGETALADRAERPRTPNERGRDTQQDFDFKITTEEEEVPTQDEDSEVGDEDVDRRSEGETALADRAERPRTPNERGRDTQQDFYFKITTAAE